MPDIQHAIPGKQNVARKKQKKQRQAKERLTKREVNLDTQEGLKEAIELILDAMEE